MRRVAQELLKWLGIITAATALVLLVNLVQLEGRAWNITKPVLTIAIGLLSILAFLLRHIDQAKQRKSVDTQRQHARVARHPLLSVRPAQPATDSAVIQAVREAVGERPRRFDAATEAYLHVEPPYWSAGPSGDPLHEVQRLQCDIRREGHVAWAAVVQANKDLWMPGEDALPASFVVGDAGFDATTHDLERLGRTLFQARRTSSGDPHLTELGRVLEDGYTRGMGLLVPTVLTGGRQAWHLSLLVPRLHLPHGYITGRVLPVWFDQRLNLALIVPAGFWPDELLARWERSETD